MVNEGKDFLWHYPLNKVKTFASLRFYFSFVEKHFETFFIWCIYK